MSLPKELAASPGLRMAYAAVKLLESLEAFDVAATVAGGGHSAQAEALRHGGQGGLPAQSVALSINDNMTPLDGRSIDRSMR